MDNIKGRGGLKKTIKVKAMIRVVENSLKKCLSTPKVTLAMCHFFPYSAFVLVYHDVCGDNDTSSWLRMRMNVFDEQMRVLSKRANIIHPHSFFDKESIKKNAINVLVTFDDGFANHRKIVLPILKKYKIPALFFVTTDNVLSGEMFWFDKVVCPIQEGKLASLDLTALGLESYAFFPKEGMRRWNDIQKLLSDIKRKGNYTTPPVQRILEHFEGTYSHLIKEKIQKYSPLSEKEILEMRDSRLCYFGSHSSKHEILTFHRHEDARESLVSSKLYLEKLLGEPVTHIAYPNGDINQTVEMLCKESGYEYGYTTRSGIVRTDTNRLCLPRISVSGYDTIQMLFWKINKAMIQRVIAS